MKGQGTYDAKYVGLYSHINPLSHNRAWERAQYINSETLVTS